MRNVRYNIPEIKVLGNAAVVIQGIKSPSNLELNGDQTPPPAYELDE